MHTRAPSTLADGHQIVLNRVILIRLEGHEVVCLIMMKRVVQDMLVSLIKLVLVRRRQDVRVRATVQAQLYLLIKILVLLRVKDHSLLGIFVTFLLPIESARNLLVTFVFWLIVLHHYRHLIYI